MSSVMEGPVDLMGWIETNKHLLKPPVGNKLIFGSGQQKVMIVGGPNIREDYHVEEGEELFYQIIGDMVLEVIEHGARKSIPIKEGEIFLLPPRIPHSPQRGPGTIGLVLERERLESERDCLRWHVKDSTDVLFQEWFHCHDLGKQLVPVMEAFFSSEDYATGRPCRPIPANAFENDSTLSLPPAQRLSDMLASVDASGEGYLFGGDGSTEYAVLAVTKDAVWSDWRSDAGEVYFHVFAGQATLTLRGEGDAHCTVAVSAGHVFLLPKATAYQAKWENGITALVITNKVVPPA